MRQIIKINLSDQIKGELAIFSSCLFFAVSAVIIKSLSHSLSGSFIALFRFIIGIGLCIMVIWLYHRPFKAYNLKFLVLRAISGSIAMIFYFIAIEMTNSSRATLLNNTFPIFSVLLGFLFFNEKIKIKSILALLICLSGVCLVFMDKSGTSLRGNIIGLLSGLAAGFSVHFIKKCREKNSAALVYLSVCIMGFFMTSFSVKGNINKLDSYQLIILIIIGVFNFIGQLLITYGLKHTTSTRGAIITFFKIPATVLLGIIFINETIKTRFLWGAALIIIGLIINSSQLNWVQDYLSRVKKTDKLNKKQYRFSKRND